MALDAVFISLLLGGGVVFMISEVLIEGWVGRLFRKRLRKVPTDAEKKLAPLKKAFNEAFGRGWTGITVLGSVSLIVSMLAFSSFETRAMFLGVSAVGLILTGLTITGSGRKRIAYQALSRAILEAMEEEKDERVEYLVQFALSFENLKMQKMAVQALEKWGGARAVVMLRDFLERARRQSSDTPPALQEYARNAFAKVKYAEEDAQKGNPNRLMELAMDYRYYRRLGQAAADFKDKNLKWFLGGDMAKKYPYYYRQQELHAAFPDVFCRQCQVRGELRKNENYTEVVCKHCKQARNLKKGIKHVRGILGNQENWILEGETLEVTLWDSEEKKASYAEIDSLEFELLDDGEVDWAVASVLENLGNQLPPEKIPIPLKNSPPEGLSANALHQLDSFTTRLPGFPLESSRDSASKNKT